MTNEQLMGKYSRLRAELNEAYSQPEWSTPRIDRIADELAAVERVLATPIAAPRVFENRSASPE